MNPVTMDVMQEEQMNLVTMDIGTGSGTGLGRGARTP